MNEGSLVFVEEEHRLLPQVANAYLDMKSKAYAQGLTLRLVSSWRSFEKQLSIWNRKALGELPLLDPNGAVINPKDLNPTQRLWAILHWSAMPGCSRHHWGTDFDVVGQVNGSDLSYDPQLEIWEFLEPGPFAEFDTWVQNQILLDSQFQFFRPYMLGLGSIQPEPWHLSHLASSKLMEQTFSPGIVWQTIKQSNIELKAQIKANFDEILAKTVYPYFNESPT